MGRGRRILLRRAEAAGWCAFPDEDTVHGGVDSALRSRNARARGTRKVVRFQAPARMVYRQSTRPDRELSLHENRGRGGAATALDRKPGAASQHFALHARRERVLVTLRNSCRVALPS